MIHSVTMTNFKQHRNLSVSFEAGLNAVQGENGNGKTTILKAILFAYFGASAAGAKEHLTTWGEQKMQVEVDATLAGLGRVRVVRGVTKAEVLKDGQLLASGQTPVTKFIEDHLGMDAKMFKTMLYAGQGETQLLLKLGAAGLQKQLETVANVEVIDRIISRIVVDNTSAAGELKGIGDAEDVASLRSTLSSLSEDYAAKASALSSIESRLSVAESTFSFNRKQYDDAVAATLQYNEEMRKLSAVRARKEATADQIKHHLASEVKQVSQDPALIRSKIDLLSNTIRDAQSRLLSHREAVSRRARIQQQLDHLQAKMPDTLQALGLLESLHTVHAQLKQAIAEQSQAHQALREAICPACNRRFEQVDLASLQDKADRSDVQVTACKLAIEAVDNRLKPLLHTLNATPNQLNGTVALLQSLEAELAGLPDLKPCDVTEETIHSDNVKLTALQQELANVTAQEQAARAWRSRLEDLQQELQIAELQDQKLTEATFAMKTRNQEELDLLRHLADQAAKTYSTLQRERDELAVAMTGMENTLQSVNARLKAAETKLQKIRELEEESALREELQKYLRKNRSKFMEDTWSSLTTYASHLIHSITDGYIHSLTRSDSGDFYVVEGGQQAPVEELSGARKSIVGLCLRLSLAHLFYGDNGFVLLDEVTADCSESNSARVAGMLRGLRSQVIMVTHRQSDAVNATHSIFLG